MPPPNTGNNSAVNFSLQQALQKITQLEQQLALLASVIRVKPGGSLEIAAPSVSIAAVGELRLSGAKITLDSALTTSAATVKCQTLTADSVVAASYTPGAGNVW